MGDDGLAMGQTEEAPNRVKKKGKKEKKLLDADGNAENDAPLETSEKPKKKKKKSEAEQQRQSESTGVEDSVPTGPAETKACQGMSRPPDATKKKRKKRKRKLECENRVDEQIERLPQVLVSETEKKKKKKDKESQETTGPVNSDICGAAKTVLNVGRESMKQGAITTGTKKKDGNVRAKKKKEKKKTIFGDDCS